MRPDPPGYSVFADESGRSERFLGFGAVLTPSRCVAHIERVLESFCCASGFFGRELSWKKCSRNEVDRYIRFVDLFFGLVTMPWDFRALILDQLKYPLRAPQYGSATEEDGFYRFYHSFLTRSIAIVAPEEEPYQLHVAVTSDRYPHRTEILRKTVGGTVGKARGRGWQIVEILRGRPKSYRLHQAADVLLGAVTCRVNDRSTGSHKRKLLEAIEERVGRRLDVDCLPDERPFNVWFFARRGDERWAPGGRGRVR